MAAESMAAAAATAAAASAASAAAAASATTASLSTVPSLAGMARHEDEKAITLVGQHQDGTEELVQWEIANMTLPMDNTLQVIGLVMPKYHHLTQIKFWNIAMPAEIFYTLISMPGVIPSIEVLMVDYITILDPENLVEYESDADEEALEGVNQLACMLRPGSGDTLKYLSLKGNQLDDSFAVAAAGWLQQHPALAALVLSHNKFTSVAGSAFAAMLRTNRTLGLLCLARNHVGDAGLVALAQSLGTRVAPPDDAAAYLRRKALSEEEKFKREQDEAVHRGKKTGGSALGRRGSQANMKLGPKNGSNGSLAQISTSPKRAVKPRKETSASPTKENNTATAGATASAAASVNAAANAPAASALGKDAGKDLAGKHLTTGE
ncbi:hypothetical protein CAUPRSCDRAFT_12158, partial [Caulochytrium protostelioides]